MRVGLLGPLEISEDGRRFSITSAKQRGLIALLALNAGSVVSADRLIEGLWGEQAGGDALNALRHHVSRLRKEIGSTLVTRASGYLLDLEPDHVDALQFARLVTDGRRGLEDHASDKVAAAFRRALALWRGAPLVEFLNHDWARQEAARLEELYLDALEHRIQADLAMGLHADLVNELQGLVREHSFRERLWGQLIGGLLVLPVGLILHEVLSWVLVLAVAGAFATLGATWAGTLLNPGGEACCSCPSSSAPESWRSGSGVFA